MSHPYFPYLGESKVVLTTNGMLRTFSKLAEQLTRDVHSDVVMTEKMLGELMLQFRGKAEGPTKAHAGDAIYGMRLFTRPTELGAQFRALTLAAIEGKSVLLVFDNGRADTVRWG